MMCSRVRHAHVLLVLRVVWLALCSLLQLFCILVGTTFQPKATRMQDFSFIFVKKFCQYHPQIHTVEGSTPSDTHFQRSLGVMFLIFPRCYRPTYQQICSQPFKLQHVLQKTNSENILGKL